MEFLCFPPEYDTNQYDLYQYEDFGNIKEVKIEQERSLLPIIGYSFLALFVAGLLGSCYNELSPVTCVISGCPTVGLIIRVSYNSVKVLIGLAIRKNRKLKSEREVTLHKNRPLPMIPQSFPTKQTLEIYDEIDNDIYLETRDES